MKRCLVCLNVLVCATLFVSAQGFFNLDFESAVIQKTDPTYGKLDWSLAAPGWSHADGVNSGSIYYGQRHTGINDVYFLSDVNGPAGSMPTQLSGRYSLSFASGTHPFYYTPLPAWISQTGTIPIGTKSIQMLATGPFEVLVGGVKIDMISLGGSSYGGDIAAFAGMAKELRIVSNNGWVSSVYTVVDNIQFSAAVVPEPSTLSIIALGMLGLCLVRR